MTTMQDLKKLGLKQNQSVEYKKDYSFNNNGVNILTEPIKLWCSFSSVAIAAQTNNNIFMNSPKNPIWSSGQRAFDFNDINGIKEFEKECKVKFEKEFEKRFNLLNKK